MTHDPTQNRYAPLLEMLHLNQAAVLSFRSVACREEYFTI
ncbi:hypothetical protein CEV32_2834 [Brucella rhizosphaerae]|uniref:Uncharacterized protein n=1 Tax=Brucella rhizosphaerae TaxID=571254 RepID=A0A256EZU3_9HYPH|nr:hypothetical protein CEV32_2834 [Brucella rhizosphaerae]